MIVPWRALSGFSVAAVIREVAWYYSVQPRTLRRGADPRHSARIQDAKDALYFELTAQRGLTPQRVAHILRAREATVRAGAARHAERISEFRKTHAAVSGRPE